MPTLPKMSNIPDLQSLWEIISLVGLAIVVFISTNVDDIFILLGFFSDPAFRPRQIIAGQYLGVGTLFFISVLGSLVSLVLAPEYIGLLGIVPVVIGLKQLYDLRRSNDDVNEKEQGNHGSKGKILLVTAVTVANGGDNIGIYTPLFATRPFFDVGVIGIVFALMIALWVWIAHGMVNHRTIGVPIRRYGYKIVPFVLIGLGFFIMHEANTLKLI